MDAFSTGDLTFGLVSYLFTGRFDLPSIGLFPGLFRVGSRHFCLVLRHRRVSLIFVGNSNPVGVLSGEHAGDIFTVSDGVVSGAIRLILYTLIPAGFCGAIPVEVSRRTTSFCSAGCLWPP